jgi:SSS family solute:Na+ symporter
MPEFLERRYDRRSRYYFSFITVIGNVLLDTAAGLYVGNIILQLLFPGMPSWAIIVILAFAAAAYTIPGGLNSVIQTEVVQAILLIIGSIVLTYFALDKVGGWSATMDGLNQMGADGAFADKGISTADEILSMFRPAGQTWQEFLMGTGGDSFMPWTGLLIGAPILGFYFWANNQFMVQRVLGAKNVNHGRWGALFAGLLKLPVIFFMVLPGTFAILLYTDVDLTAINYTLANGEICQNLRDCPNATYPVLLFDLLPTGMLGLVLAGLLAAMMSSVSATFNSASTLVTMDFVRNLRPGLSSKQLVRVGQITTLILVVLASAWAPQIEKWGSLWEYLQIILSYICPPVAAAFVLGLFWKRANGTGAFISMLIGFVLSVIIIYANSRVDVVADSGDSISGILWFLGSVHFLHMAFYLFVLCTLLNIGISVATEPPDPEKVAHYTWSKKIFKEESEELKGLPWYQNYRILAAILLVITALVVSMFA